MDHKTEVCAEKSLKKGEYPNVLQKFPTLNVHSENSFVKIGDEFNFSKNVLIVVPDDLHPRKTSQSDENKEKKENEPQRDGKNLSDENLNRVKIKLLTDWLLRYNPTTTHKTVFALIFVIATVVLLIISSNLNSNAEGTFEIPDYVNRSLWESQPRKCAYSRLETPVPLVIIQETLGTFCYNFSECQQSVKNSQNYHMSRPYYCDVKFGFLVGGDCRIYEGRNFSQREDIGPNDPFYNRSVEVAFIGDYSRNQPLDCQIKNFLAFLKNSVTTGFLEKDFKVVGALQAYKDESKGPGKYLLDQIQQLKMWSNETLSPPQFN